MNLGGNLGREIRERRQEEGTGEPADEAAADAVEASGRLMDAIRFAHYYPIYVANCI